MVESADRREEACEIRDGRCKPETRLFAGWVSVQGERAVRRAGESEEGGKSFQREVIGCSWPPFLFEHLPAAVKICISLLCDVAWEKLLKVRITVVFLDRCCPPLLCLPSCSCLVLHLLKKRSLHQGMPYFKNCAWLL